MIKKTYDKQQRGFTLIELSIAIVVIGILVGGVVLGGKVIEQSKFSKFLTEFQTLQTSVNLFKDNYLAYPGDYNGVKSIQQEAGQTCLEDRSNVNDLTRWPNVCPGNNDGTMDFGESHFGINHLVYEEYLASDFSRRTMLLASGKEISDPTGMFPKSYKQDIEWTLYNGYLDNSITGTRNEQGGNYLNPNWITTPTIQMHDNMIRISGQGLVDQDALILGPELAYRIDSKIDDGIGISGLIVINHGGCNVTNTAGTKNWDYGSIEEDEKHRPCSIAYLLEQKNQ